MFTTKMKILLLIKVLFYDTIARTVLLLLSNIIGG